MAGYKINTCQLHSYRPVASDFKIKDAIYSGFRISVREPFLLRMLLTPNPCPDSSVVKGSVPQDHCHCRC